MSKLPPPRKVPALTADGMNRLHEKIQAGYKTTVRDILLLGENLSNKKEELGHGNWLPWVEENLKFGAHQAAKYTRAYERRGELLSNETSGSDLSLNGIVKLLADPEPAAGGRLKSRITGDQKVRPPGTQTAHSSEKELWKRHEDETKEILIRISTVEGNLRKVKGLDDFWNQVDLDAALSHLKEVRKCLTVTRNWPRSKTPPPKKKPA